MDSVICRSRDLRSDVEAIKSHAAPRWAMGTKLLLLTYAIGAMAVYGHMDSSRRSMFPISA